MSNAGTWALAYASRGWHVFPCKPDKKPYTEHGFKDATTDPKIIRAWWTQWPDAQIGVACGASGIVVVDLDLDKAKGLDGIAAFGEFLGPNPHGCALIAHTPRGGRHFVYADTEHKFGIGTDVGSMLGIDVRAVGGYFIVPAGESPREWITGDPLDHGDLLPPPAHLLPILPPAGGQQGGRQSGSMAPSGTATAERCSEVWSALQSIPASMSRPGWLRAIWAAHAALDADEQGAAMVETWSETTSVAGQHKPTEAFGTYATAVLPWHARQGRRLVDAETLFHMAYEHGWSWTTADRADADLAQLVEKQTVNQPMATQPEPDVFLPSLLHGDDLLMRAIRDCMAKAILPQPALTLGAALATSGALLGRKVEVDNGDSSPSRTNIYTVGVGPSGCGKNHPLSYYSDLLNLSGDTLNGPREYMSESGIYAALQDMPCHCAFLDEFGLILQATQGHQAPAHLRGICKALLTLFTSAHRTVQGAGYANRRENKPVPIVEPCLSIAGFTTPETLFDSLTTKNVTDGLLGRCLVFEVDGVPKKPRGRRLPGASRGSGKPSQAIVDDVKALLAALRPPNSIGADLGGAPKNCRRFHFSAEAARFIDEYVLAAEEENGRKKLGAMWRRLEEHVVKLALIRAAAASPTNGSIGLEFTTWAYHLASWCFRRLSRGFDANVADTETERDAKRVLRIIRDAGADRINAATLTRKTQWLRRNERKDLIAGLIEAGLVGTEAVESNRPDGKGKSTVWYFAMEVES
jgi:hypothetical protein